MTLQRNLTDLRMHALNRFHRTVRALSGGRLMGSELMGMKVVELHVTGRKSGARRSTMLTAPVFEDDRIVLVASKGGADRDPEWYQNLVANPEIELTIDGSTTAWWARTAGDEERAALWARITAAYKGYAGYQRRTDRSIPIVICERR